MKYGGTLAVVLGVVSSTSCSKDNVIGTLGNEGRGSSGTGAGGTSETSAVTGGGAAVAGSTSRGGAAPAGGTGARISGTLTGGSGGNSGGRGNTAGTGGHIIASAGGVPGGNGVGGSAIGTSGMGGRVPSAVGTGGSTPDTGSVGGTGGSTPGTGGTGGGSISTGGSPTGIGSSSFSLGGAAGSGSSVPPSAMGFACPLSPASCNLIHTWKFSPTSQWAGTFVFGDAFGDTTTDPTVFHVTGIVSVSDYAGFGIYMQKCTSLAGFTGMTFTLKGTSASPTSPNTLTFVLQTNTDEPIDTAGMKGECQGQVGVNCFSPNKLVTTSDKPQTIMFSDFAGGKPVALADVTEVIGVYWQIGPGAAPFAIDLSLSDVTLIGPGPMGDCSMDSGSTVPGGSGGSTASD